jgi:hypothetical protein
VVTYENVITSVISPTKREWMSSSLFFIPQIIYKVG